MEKKCHDIMAAAVSPSTAECIICKEQVPISPREVASRSGKQNCSWWDIVSPTCVSYSNFGSKLGMLDPSNIPLWIWTYQTLHFQPDVFLLENVPKFNLSFLFFCLGRVYSIEHAILNPKLFGLPASGDRMFVKGSLSTHLSHPAIPFSLESFSNFMRETSAVGSIFTVASKQEQRSWHDHQCKLRGLTPARKRYRHRDLLTPANRFRLERLEGILKSRDDIQLPLFLNISQNPDFSTMTMHMPRLVTSSQIWLALFVFVVCVTR